MEYYQCINECKIWVSSSQKYNKASEDWEFKHTNQGLIYEFYCVTLCFWQPLLWKKPPLVFNRGLGTSWGWVNNDTVCTLRGTIPSVHSVVSTGTKLRIVIFMLNMWSDITMRVSFYDFFCTLLALFFLHSEEVIHNVSYRLQILLLAAFSIIMHCRYWYIIIASLSLSVARMHSKFHLKN